MKYFVYFDAGSCQAGDYTSDLIEFDDLPSARKRVKELQDEYHWEGSGLTVSLIEGVELDINS